MNRAVSPSTYEQWHEADVLFRASAARWFEMQAHLHSTADPVWAARYAALADAAGTSASAFTLAWRQHIGPGTASDIAESLAEESVKYDSYIALIQDAMRCGEMECEYSKDYRPFKTFEQIVDWELEMVELMPETSLVIDHAVYALYVAWSPQSRIVVPDTRGDLLRELTHNPELVRVVSPRAFEELIAYLYERLGCRVELTQQSRDFGADVLAWHPGPLGHDLLLAIQVKRYDPRRSVGLKALFELHGAVTHYKAHSGHVVTTSRYSDPAVQFAQEQGYRLVAPDDIRIEMDRIFS
jgi:HJR/Mrr/RecB family endonuclease